MVQLKQKKLFDCKKNLKTNSPDDLWRGIYAFNGLKGGGFSK